MKKIILKQFLNLRKADLLSAIFGMLGVIAGLLSICALQPGWNSERDSSILTIITIIFDILSTFMAVFAFNTGETIKHIKEVKKIRIHRRECIAIRLDVASFFLGIVGLVFGWVSLIALFNFWNNSTFSMWATVLSVICDFWSFATVFATVLLIKSLKKNYIS